MSSRSDRTNSQLAETPFPTRTCMPDCSNQPSTRSHARHDCTQSSNTYCLMLSESLPFLAVLLVGKVRRFLGISAHLRTTVETSISLPAAAIVTGPAMPLTSSLDVAEGCARYPASRPLPSAINRQTNLAPKQNPAPPSFLTPCSAFM